MAISLKMIDFQDFRLIIGFDGCLGGLRRHVTLGSRVYMLYRLQKAKWPLFQPANIRIFFLINQTSLRFCHFFALIALFDLDSRPIPSHPIFARGTLCGGFIVCDRQ